jgi:hypothetical protein
MTTSTDTLERLLVHDLDTLGDRLSDDRLCRDLYAAFAGYALHRRDTPGRLTLSWGRAEELINGARAAHALPPMDGLAQSGHEGELTNRARAVLEELGWDVRPRRTDEHDDAHSGRPASPPPADRSEPEWEREGHTEAEAERHRQRTGETRRELHDRHG